ncbi:MAG: VOC family protein [Myxococcales bacterium]|nr:VOC family protein [Myxococcales bacterium]
MRLGYVILYVADVEKTVRFYEKAFGLSVRMLHESGHYAEMATGETRLAFASREVGQGNFPDGFQHCEPQQKPWGMEIALVADDVAAAYQKALEAGASALMEPQQKPWGQVVAYVRDQEGFLIELCSPMA